MSSFIIWYKSNGQTDQQHLDGENYLHDVCSTFERYGYRYMRLGVVDNDVSIDQAWLEVWDHIGANHRSTVFLPELLEKKPPYVFISICPKSEQLLDSDRIIWQFKRVRGAGATDWRESKTKATDEITGISVIMDGDGPTPKYNAVLALTTLVDAHENPEKSIS